MNGTVTSTNSSSSGTELAWPEAIVRLILVSIGVAGTAVGFAFIHDTNGRQRQAGTALSPGSRLGLTFVLLSGVIQFAPEFIHRFALLQSLSDVIAFSFSWDCVLLYGLGVNTIRFLCVRHVPTVEDPEHSAGRNVEFFFYTVLTLLASAVLHLLLRHLGPLYSLYFLTSLLPVNVAMSLLVLWLHSRNGKKRENLLSQVLLQTEKKMFVTAFVTLAALGSVIQIAVFAVRKDLVSLPPHWLTLLIYLPTQIRWSFLFFNVPFIRHLTTSYASKHMEQELK